MDFNKVIEANKQNIKNIIRLITKEDNEDLETGKDLIDVVNEWAKNRGKFKKGSNKNPVSEKEKAKPAEEANKTAEQPEEPKEEKYENKD